MVVGEGGEVRTLNVCQQCNNERLAQQGQAATEIVAIERNDGEESASWIFGR